MNHHCKQENREERVIQRGRRGEFKTVHYSAMQCNIVQKSAMQCNTEQFRTLQNNTVKYSKLQ